MPEWLLDSFPVTVEPALHVLVVRIAAALALGCVVAGIYRLTAGKSNSSALGLMATLVLLTVLIAMVTQVIGDSVARAFGLVGALSIVRFRTVVEDTRDTAFVIFAVGVGMAAGAGFLKVPLVGIPFAAAAAFLFRARDVAYAVSLDALLSVRIGAGHDPETLIRAPLDQHVQQHTLKSITTARQGAAIELTYAIRLRRADTALSLVGALNKVEGIQSVELRQG